MIGDGARHVHGQMLLVDGGMSAWQQPEGGRRRRYYELTPDGEALLRERRADWESRPADIHDVLAAGAKQAREKAGAVLARAQEACGLRGR